MHQRYSTACWASEQVTPKLFREVTHAHFHMSMKIKCEYQTNMSTTNVRWSLAEKSEVHTASKIFFFTFVFQGSLV